MSWCCPRSVVAVVVVFACVGACSGGGGGSGKTGTEAVKTIDKSGGMIPLGTTGAILKIPAGALNDPTPISVQDTGTKAPDGSPVYRFLPEGTMFQKPVEVQMPVPAGMTAPTIWWTDGTRTSAFPLANTKADGLGNIVGWVGHFSSGYVAPQTITSFFFDPGTVTCGVLGGQSESASVAAIVMTVSDRAIANACTAVRDVCSARPSMETITIVVAGISTTGPAQVPLGDYPIVYVSLATAGQLSAALSGGKAASIFLQRTDASCGASTPVQATSGTITLESTSPVLELYYKNVTFADGTRIDDGEFEDPVPCPGRDPFQISGRLQSFLNGICTPIAPSCSKTPVCQ